VSVGNDVVDLADPESRLEGLHPRFDERVFGDGERAALEASASRQLLHWAFWAAKESAYKARRRLDPSVVFSPREFEVELPPLPPAGGSAAGRVVHRGRCFALEVHADGAWVHAVARSGNAGGARVVSAVERIADEPGLAVRHLAAATIAASLALGPDELLIVGRPPVVMHRGRPIEATVSLSHHGRFAAVAFVPGRPSLA
jgi:hypothetical protein